MIVCEPTNTVVNDANIAAKILRKTYADLQDGEHWEHMCVMGLNAINIVLYIDIVGMGNLTSCTADPRNIFRTAIIRDCAAIILSHNHISGKVAPSTNDRQTTEKMVKAGVILSIPVLDHIIIGMNTNNFYSFEEQGEV